MGIGKLFEVTIRGFSPLYWWVTILGINLAGLWVGWECNEDCFEFRIEVYIWKLSLSLPVSWLKRE